jgi:hypothetical protein
VHPYEPIVGVYQGSRYSNTIEPVFEIQTRYPGLLGVLEVSESSKVDFKSLTSFRVELINVEIHPLILQEPQ